jgi:REP element-mobilizing transposase RayT
VKAYQHSRNKIFLIQYHLVWCPKRRKPVLVGKVEKRLEQVIYQVADAWGVKVLELAVNQTTSVCYIGLSNNTSPQDCEEN